jgi:ribosomal protein L37AE/L43A
MPAKKKTLKKYVVKSCPKCKSDDIGVAIGGQMGIWECHKCGFRGPSFLEKEMSEEEFLDYEEKKGGADFDLSEPKTVEEKKSHKEMLKEKLEAGEKI